MHVATATHSTAKNIAPESSKLCTQILQILTTASNNLNSEQSVKASRATAVSESSRSNCDTPLSSLASNSGSSSSARVEHFIETDSGKSSCEPILLDESVDSGIMVEFKDLELHKRIQQCQRILKALERDKENYRRLRERLSKISDRKNRKILAVKQEPRCNVCCTELNVKDPKCFVTCGTCNKMICRNISCADWFPKSSQWECQLCYSKKETFSQTSTWVAEQMCFNQQKMIQYPMRARSEIYIPIHDFTENNTMQFDSVSQMGLNCSDISAEQKIKIREYVEELVSNILGGSLDKVAVNQISKSENYLPGIINGAKQEEKENENDFSDISETRLRKLISTIIGETLRLPVLKSATSEKNLRQRSALLNGSVEKHNQYFEPENYQDLLATAVLNRIIEKQHIARILGESAEDLNQTDVDINYNKEDISGSSADPKSDYSYSDEDHNDNESKYKRIHGRESALSDYIASHTVPLPDLSNANTDDEASSSFMGEGTWEDNWLFKKKTLDTSSISGGSRILIPAPKEDIRAQIGDQVADEVSDLSEMGSDTDESSLKKDLDPVNDRLRDKQLIGGNNSKLVLDELMNTSQTLESEQKTENKSSTESDVYPVSAPVLDSSQDYESCTGYSTLEYFDYNLSLEQEVPATQSRSVIELLAAIALAPMLAVPATDKETVLYSSEINALKELNELALAEIRARSEETIHQPLSVIEEEVTNVLTDTTIEEIKFSETNNEDTDETFESDTVKTEPIVSEPETTEIFVENKGESPKNNGAFKVTEDIHIESVDHTSTNVSDIETISTSKDNNTEPEIIQKPSDANTVTETTPPEQITVESTPVSEPETITAPVPDEIVMETKVETPPTTAAVTVTETTHTESDESSATNVSDGETISTSKDNTTEPECFLLKMIFYSRNFNLT